MLRIINILELYNLLACTYLNCYHAYLEILNNDDVLEFWSTLLHRMHIYYEILEIRYDSVNEQRSFAPL